VGRTAFKVEELTLVDSQENPFKTSGCVVSCAASEINSMSAFPADSDFKNESAEIAWVESCTTNALASEPSAAETALSHPGSTDINEATLPRISIPRLFVKRAPLPSLCKVACRSASTFALAAPFSFSAFESSSINLSRCDLD